MPTIHQIKELQVADTPLILFECELSTGALERWSTHAVQFNGQIYAARVLRHNLFDLRWGADDGIDSLSRISLTLANADSYLSQITHNAGWKGAKLTATFLFYNLKDEVAVSEAMVLFRGLVNPPDEITEFSLRLSAHNRLNLQRFLLPEVRIQKRCPWSFPSTAEQRDEALNGGDRGKYSPFFRCGYSAGQPAGLGNLNAGNPFTSCDYTRASCVARGMFDRDSLNQPTRRYGGLEFVPASILVRGHGESGSHPSSVADNQTRYNDFVPLQYGTVWTQPPVVFARNDGNLTRTEVLLGMGEIEMVLKVVVNGVEIPQGIAGNNMTATGWYNLVNNGSTTGGFNLEFTDSSGNPLGDPYGSMAYLAISIPNRVSDGRVLPQVRVLIQGLKLATFDENGTFTGDIFTNNPAWVLLDMLRRSGWTLDELDIPTFHQAATYCGGLITVSDLTGALQQTPRFQCNLELRRRRSVSDWIRGVRAGARLYLGYGPSGLLELRVEGDLASQQAVKPATSNSTATLNGGWPAYEFGDGSTLFTSILRRDSGESTVRLWSRSTAETPNRSSIEFQDEFNEYQQDSLSLVDVDDAIVSRQEVSVGSSALGVPNFHQAARVLRLQLDKAVRGNLFVEFETSVRGIGLRPGDLITITYARENFQRSVFRITRVAPSLNHATAVIEAQIHDDSWYTDDPGAAGSRVSRRQRNSEVSIPRPLVGAEFDAAGNPQFSVQESVEEEGDGGAEIVAEAGFSVPARPSQNLDIPALSLTPTVTTTGGTLAGGQSLYYAVSAEGAGGEESPISFVIRAELPPGTSTNKVELTSLRFSPSATAFHVYRGANPSQILRIASSVPLAASFTDTGLATTLQGPPDENYDHARFEWRLEYLPEVTATIFTISTIGSSTLNLSPDEFTTLIVRLTGGKGRGQERSIVSHTVNTIAIQGTWVVIPDATTKFVIVDSSWQFGATGATSPVRFHIPNRPGATIHLCGKAVNAVGRDSGYDLSPQTRWQIGGSLGSGVDQDVPPLPNYGINLTGQGTVELVGVSFPTLTNTKTVFAGTLRMFFWDELASPSTYSLAAAVTASAAVITLNTAASLPTGTLLQIESEIMLVQSAAGSVVTVTRASHASTADTHASATPVYILQSKTYIVPFPKNFFGSPASGVFAYPVFLPDVRLAAAELFVTNNVGNSETSKANFTITTDFGLRTLSGGQITMQVEGHLAIQTGAAPPLVVENAHSVRDIFAIVRESPTGAPIQLQLKQNESVYCTLTVPTGATISNIADGFGLPPLTAMSTLHLDILSVGQTAESAPGRDLTVTIRL